MLKSTFEMSRSTRNLFILLIGLSPAWSCNTVQADPQWLHQDKGHVQYVYSPVATFYNGQSSREAIFRYSCNLAWKRSIRVYYHTPQTARYEQALEFPRFGWGVYFTIVGEQGERTSLGYMDAPIPSDPQAPQVSWTEYFSDAIKDVSDEIILQDSYEVKGSVIELNISGAIWSFPLAGAAEKIRKANENCGLPLISKPNPPILFSE